MSKVSSVVHNFQESLELSHSLNEEADWIAFYKRIWPDALTIVRVDKKSTVQTRGIDRMIWLPSGKQITVDEKCRASDYGDILLEITSVGWMIKGVFAESKVGWALDDAKHCDYVAYAIPNAKKCYMLPFELCKEALRHSLPTWRELKRKDGIAFPIDAQNKGYTTRSIGVSWLLLKEAISKQMSRQFGSTNELPAVRMNGLSQMEFDW